MRLPQSQDEEENTAVVEPQDADEGETAVVEEKLDAGQDLNDLDDKNLSPAENKNVDYAEPQEHDTIGPGDGVREDDAHEAAIVVAARRKRLEKRGTKRARKEVNTCPVEGCNGWKEIGGFCTTHGGGRRCQVEGCKKRDQGHGKCIAHGAPTKLCEQSGCKNRANRFGFCQRHGGFSICNEPGCDARASAGGYCLAHGGGRCHMREPRRCQKKCVRYHQYCAEHLQEGGPHAPPRQQQPPPPLLPPPTHAPCPQSGDDMGSTHPEGAAAGFASPPAVTDSEAAEQTQDLATNSDKDVMRAMVP
ncbi:Hypothetical Protein FCC1311_099432 [Hondaea fermentalgiana]|uniref:WRKY19-like zinc finger domain-containing protein n=1 Tax=Hondaea fermentalgiana TaxID=2315210 RepID=A0A2R5GS94_9STRA|nr:Hypothetical Protein FCC1311_099432 [Hondaea fermentalgiana]|eukprot:GBG33720.1 Hypothetical Protein FCC1311_099432 [Hondaea fermentalgiana]